MFKFKRSQTIPFSLVCLGCFILLQSSFSWKHTEQYIGSDTLIKTVPVAQVKYIAKGRDDIAWENDRIAFRIYGPALEKKEPTGSGIDVWVKSVRYPIIEKWYAGDNYHEDKGEGLDFYGVGHSRGCGGLGVWDGQTLLSSGHWQSYHIRATEGDSAVFTINYAPWKLSAGHEVSEQRTITLLKGTNLNRLDCIFTCDLPELIIGIGIAKIKGGEIYQDREKGIMAFWPPLNVKHGYIGCGVLVSPQDILGFAEDKLNYIVLVKVKPGKPLVYYAGACWSKGLDYATFADWKNELVKHSFLN
jgi:hypothetical protein